MRFLYTLMLAALIMAPTEFEYQCEPLPPPPPVEYRMACQTGGVGGFVIPVEDCVPIDYDDSRWSCLYHAPWIRYCKCRCAPDGEICDDLPTFIHPDDVRECGE